jgi:glycosyltransferase involved in cell wall biosynthesis
MLPQVSVIVPAFNCAAFVGEAVRSALDQNDVQVQVIVVDDGSTDDTPRVLADFGDRIEVVGQPNSGPGAARNLGMQRARGGYIAFLDADDVWLPGKLAAQAAHLEANSGTEAVYCRWHVWAPDGDGSYRIAGWATRPVDRSAGIAADASGSLYTSLLLDCHILTSTVVMRRSLMQRLGGFDEGLRCGEDYDYWLRMSRQARIDCMAMVGTLYRMSATSATHRPQPVNAEREVLLRALDTWGRAGPDGTEVPADALARRLEQLSDQFGHAHLWRGDPRLAMGWIGARLSADPVRPKLWGLAAVAGVRWLLGARGGQGQR